MIAFMIGLVIVMGGLGGMDSVSTAVVIQSGMLTVAGLALMWAGVDSLAHPKLN